MSLIDIFYPKTCVNCGYLGAYLCPDCYQKLAYLDQQLCFYCGCPSLNGLTHPGCVRHHQVDGSLSIFHYNFLLKKIVKQFKYRLARSVLTDFMNSINWFEQYIFLKRLPKDTVFQPIPLHQDRFLKRGFNQARLVAEGFNLYLHFSIIDLLQRKINTEPQANIKDKKERRKNLKQAFGFIQSKNITPKTVVLVDDVLTTGATLGAAAYILKKAGVKKIYVLTLARG